MTIHSLSAVVSGALRKGLAAIVTCSAMAINVPVASADPITVSVGIDPAFSPVYVAQQRGLFAKAGLDVKLLRVAQGGEAMDAIIAGQAQLGVAADQTVILRLGRADLRPLAILHDSEDYLRAVARPGVDEPAQVKKMGIVKGTVSEYCASMFAEKYGLGSNITYVNASGPEFVALLLRGDIDAFFSWPPFPSMALKQGAKDLATNGKVGYLSTMWVTASPSWVASHETEAHKFLAVLAEANRQMTADLPAAAADFQKQTKLSAADTLPLFGLLRLKLRDFADDDLKSFDKMAEFQFSRKATPSKVDVKSFLARGFVREP
ncbi:ABC transporter substrate-binding protein [Bradyrhizobium sp. CCBAU 53338]|uniref:ABC transporter substrate-binding protein n=1 Tax=Bradyrhizobium sp. CCBAU 53338 TaxID=1325111 RepID=UPI00188CFB61|nr:ABC transporter substrate-binding protein [Bradyrhizobium sp. CCBAU 53338]QOZ52521.1 ABC transporter substrate-binding protein [Bradyrhizobium sp. CCBAU 53338]